MRVSVEVTGADLTAPINADTVIIPPEPVAEDVTKGSAAIAVVDEAAQPVSGVSVSFADAFHPLNSLAALTTGSDGCLFVPGLEPSASLTVTVSKDGFVSSTPTGTEKVVTISAGTVAKATFEYAQAARVQFTGADPEHPLPAAMPVLWQVKGTGGSAQEGVVNQPVTGLWPGNEIEAWAGACTDADPLSTLNARSAYDLAAGQVTLAALATAPVKVRGLPEDAVVVAKPRARRGRVPHYGDHAGPHRRARPAVRRDAVRRLDVHVRR